MQIDTKLAERKALLSKSRSIAVVGLSPKETRPSNMVARYLLDAGFTVIPVNPGQDEILGLKCYANLSAIPEPIDIVNIFRRSEDVLPIVEEALNSTQARGIWMQQGIINLEAEKLASSRGLVVVMDRCIKIDHQAMQD